MNDKEKLMKCINEMLTKASEQETRLVYIATKEILRKRGVRHEQTGKQEEYRN